MGTSLIAYKERPRHITVRYFTVFYMDSFYPFCVFRHCVVFFIIIHCVVNYLKAIVDKLRQESVKVTFCPWDR